jgi:hypothetical protein
MIIRLATGYLGLFFLLCLIGRFIFCLLHTAAAGLAGWVVLIFASCILITYYSLFLLGDESSTMYFFVSIAYFCFNFICFVFCFLFFKLCYFFLFCKINIYSFARIACLVWFSSSHNYHIS